MRLSIRACWRVTWGALWIGTESKPYAVKPSAFIVAEAIGTTPLLSAADVEFACKGGTEALRIAFGFIGSRIARYALAIGMDTVQARPGDELELTAAAGGGAIVVGPAAEALALVEHSASYSSDLPDFFPARREEVPRIRT
jgi:hydroxymethylglutaryl-CoA synthase